MTSMSIFEFVDGCASCFGKQLISHANTTNRFFAYVHLSAKDVNGIHTHVRVSWTISKEQSIKIHGSIVIIPWHSYHLDISFYETPYNICLNTTINKDNLFADSLIISYNILATYFINKVNTFIFRLRNDIRLVVKKNLSHHDTMFTQHLCQLPCVYACDSWDTLSLEPVSETFHGIPMAVSFTIISYYYRRSINSVTLHE